MLNTSIERILEKVQTNDKNYDLMEKWGKYWLFYTFNGKKQCLASYSTKRL